jgi:hypothetical protein
MSQGILATGVTKPGPGLKKRCAVLPMRANVRPLP